MSQAEEETNWPDLFGQVLKAREAIIAKEGKRRGVRGHIPCPIDGGRLDYSIAFNGHIAGKCSNAKCVGWME